MKMCLEKCDMLCGELGGLLLESSCYIITDYNRFVEAVQSLPRTNRNARLFTEYVLKNLEVISHSQNEVIFPNSLKEFFEGIEEMEVVKVNYDWKDFSFIYVYSKENEKIKRRLNDKQANSVLTYQSLSATFKR